MEEDENQAADKDQSSMIFYRSILKRLYYLCKLGFFVFRDFKRQSLFATEGIRRDNNCEG